MPAPETPRPDGPSGCAADAQRGRYPRSGASTRRASRLPAPTASRHHPEQRRRADAAPTTPNSSGITVLDALIAIERNAIASPWRSAA